MADSDNYNRFLDVDEIPFEVVDDEGAVITEEEEEEEV